MHHLRLTDWFKRRLLGGNVKGDADWPLEDVSAGGAPLRFDGIRVTVDSKQVTLAEI